MLVTHEAQEEQRVLARVACSPKCTYIWVRNRMLVRRPVFL
jgi:hypothetical protein